MKLEAIVFDFDGLILETETPQYEAMRMLYAEHEQTFPMQRWIDILGMPPGSSDLLGDLEKLIGRTLDRQAMSKRWQEEIKRRLDAARPLPGVEALLKEAKAARLPLAVASGSNRPWVVGHLQTHELLDYFDAIITAEDTTEHKPRPAPFLAACAALNASPARTIALEDSPNGIAAASAGGLCAVAVPTLMTRQQTFPGARHRLRSLADIDLAWLAQALHQPASNVED